MYMQPGGSRRAAGFTVVELLIVIVVIGILATLTIIAYSGVQDQARTASIQSDLEQNSRLLETYKYKNNESYPADLAAAQTAGLKLSGGATAQYYSNPGMKTYCLSVTDGTRTQFTYPGGSPQQGDCSVSSGLVGWWRLNANGNDSSGSANTATINGATSTAGPSGQSNTAYLFNNGSANYLALQAGNTSLDLTTNFSVSAWVRVSAGATSTWYDILAGTNSDWGMGIQYNGSGIGYHRLTKVSVQDAGNSTVPVTAGQWYNLVITYNSGSLAYYMNATPNGTASFNPGFTISTKNIGRRANGSGYFNGIIDDVRVYNRALSQSEVEALYAAGAQ